MPPENLCGISAAKFAERLAQRGLRAGLDSWSFFDPCIDSFGTTHILAGPCRFETSTLIHDP